MIVLTTTLSDFIAIFKNVMHLLENHNSIHTPAKCGRSTHCVVQGTHHTLCTAILHAVCGPKDSPHPAYSYSPCSVWSKGLTTPCVQLFSMQCVVQGTRHTLRTAILHAVCGPYNDVVFFILIGLRRTS